MTPARIDPEDHEVIVAGLAAHRAGSRFQDIITGWRRTTRFIGYRDSHAFGGELQGWLSQIERGLLREDVDLFGGLQRRAGRASSCRMSPSTAWPGGAPRSSAWQRE